MPRVHVNTLLKHATENKYGVAAVNTLNVETVKYIIEAAEREREIRSISCGPSLSE